VGKIVIRSLEVLDKLDSQDVHIFKLLGMDKIGRISFLVNVYDLGYAINL